jgi:Xaa-Pro dipeptidase
VTAGVTERRASDAIRDLAADMFGVTWHWHKRIVRAGPNTLQPYEWEADVGRTIVLGGDPRKHELAAALPLIWQRGRDYFASHPDVTGEELYACVAGLAEQDGWVSPERSPGT